MIDTEGEPNREQAQIQENGEKDRSKKKLGIFLHSSLLPIRYTREYREFRRTSEPKSSPTWQGSKP